MSDGILDQASWQAEKAASRRLDAERIARGEVTGSELSRENGFFSALPLEHAVIVAIGAGEIRRWKQANGVPNS